MDGPSLRELARLLRRPGAVPRADGLAVSVTTVRLVRGHDGREIEIRYAVPPLPDGVARQPLPRAEESLTAYASIVAEELQGWATEHVRRYRPLPQPDRNQVARELPSADALWRDLLAELQDVEQVPGGFVGSYEDRRVTVLLTPESWQGYVVDCEIRCRNDYGVDADRPGSGPAVALGDLDETIATLRPDETFVVLDGRRLVGSTRAGLAPPLQGRAGRDDRRQHDEP